MPGLKFLTILLLLPLALSARAQEDSVRRNFTFPQATLLIHDCSIYVIQSRFQEKGENCFDIFLQLSEWTRERYVGPEEAAQALLDSTKIGEAYVPAFTLATHASLLDEEQKKIAAKAMMDTLDKMFGLGGRLEYENENRAEQFIRFMVDALVSMAVSGVETKAVIEYLNERAKVYEYFRKSYQLSFKSRIRFMLDFASIEPLREMTVEQKTHHFSVAAFRPFSFETRYTVEASHSENATFKQRRIWKSEASKLVIDRPLFKVLEGMLNNIGDRTMDRIDIKTSSGEVIDHRYDYLLDEMGVWSRDILEKLGFDVIDRSKGERKKAPDYLSPCEALL